MLSIAVSFVVLGALGTEYQKRSYKGGAPAITGASFGVLGMQFLVLFVEQYFRGEDVELWRGALLAFVVFFVAGTVLLRYGHVTHKASLNPDHLSR